METVSALTAEETPRFSRRRLLEIGSSAALGLSFAHLSGRSVAAAPNRAKSVLFVFLFGGPSQLDTFDPKPDAPDDFRGEFSTIATTIPGVRFCEHLPRMAQSLSQYALIRSMRTNRSFGDHRLAVHGLLCGIDELPPGSGLPASRRDWPCLCAGAQYLLPRQPGLPTSIVLPGEIVDPGTGTYPGQTAGMLGADYDPFRVDRNPNADDYQVDGSLRMSEGMSIDRLGSKRQLLASIDRQRAQWEATLSDAAYIGQQREAFEVLTSGRLASALDLGKETVETRERYGRHLFGQSMLLARRLIEAGVPIVQANVSYQALWDTHNNNFKGLRELLPPFDLAASTLLADMQERGLLNETLVVIMGEFGRTPKLVKPTGQPAHFVNAGRDHWMDSFWAIFAGAGVQPGQVIGRSDAVAAFPVTRAFTPADVGATVYGALGIGPDAEVRDMQQRPLQLNRGSIIEPLYRGNPV